MFPARLSLLVKDVQGVGSAVSRLSQLEFSLLSVLYLNCVAQRHRYHFYWQKVF